MASTKKLVRIGTTAIIMAALLLPLAYSFTMFGFHGQLQPTDYPEGWETAKEFLNSDGDDYNLLVLPWHQYMDYNWVANKDKRVYNPARQFFDKPVIQGDNFEMPSIYSQSTNPVSEYVEFLLSKRDTVDNLGELLAPLNVKYVILVKEADYKYYDYLYQQEDLSTVMDKPGITLFKNQHPTARVYGIDNVVYINNLEEYLQLSKKQDVMNHVYVIGSGPSDDGSTQMEKLIFVEKSPVTYLIGGTSLKYTTFVVPQNVSKQYWEYGGKKPAFYNLGFMPAFASTADGGEIVYTRFYRIYLPCYVISALTLGLMVYFYFRSLKPKVRSRQGQTH